MRASSILGRGVAAPTRRHRGGPRARSLVLPLAIISVIASCTAEPLEPAPSGAASQAASRVPLPPPPVDDESVAGVIVFQPPAPPSPAPVEPPPRPVPPSTPGTTTEVFHGLSTITGGGAYSTPDAPHLPETLRRIIGDLTGTEGTDIAFVIDTTGSMSDDLVVLKENAPELLERAFDLPGQTRAAVVYYRDRREAYVSHVEQPFTTDLAVADAAIKRASIGGGGDYQEHVYGGLLLAMSDLDWRSAASKVIVLIGDAPPHEDYAGEGKTEVEARAAELGVAIYTVVIGGT